MFGCYHTAEHWPVNNMLHFQINPHSGVPVYRQMIDQIKYYVASGALKAEDQLPSIRELAPPTFAVMNGLVPPF